MSTHGHAPRTLLAALAAAALLSSACDDGPRPSPRSPLPPRAPLPSAEVTVDPEPLSLLPADGGLAVDEAPVELLGLSHQDRGHVDHLGRATRLREEGDLLGALAEARRAVFDAGDDEEALLELAQLAQRCERHDLAADSWARLAELAPDDPSPVIRRARALLTLGEVARAVTVAKEAVARDPQNPEAYQVAGRAYLSAGDLVGATSMFEKVVELDPEHGYALNNLGLCYLRANRNQEAVEVLTRASDLLPTVAFVFNNLGVAYERVGRLTDAKGAFALASSLSPRYVKAQVNRARLARLAAAAQVEVGLPAGVRPGMQEGDGGGPVLGAEALEQSPEVE